MSGSNPVDEESGRKGPGVRWVREVAGDAVARCRTAAATLPERVRRNPWPAMAVLLYGACLLFFRPVMPFEWDEVLFQRSLDDYNVTHHSPHPPGYPAYVGAAKLVRVVARDPLLALQLVGILGAIVVVIVLPILGRRLGAPSAAGGAAAVLVAVTPAFAFNANVGLSDVAGAAAGVVAASALVIALESPAALPLAAAATALAAGIRPQLLALLAPLAIAAAVAAIRRREPRRLVIAAVVGLVVCDLIWLPALYATGPGFWGAWRDHANTLSAVERTLRLPGADLESVATYWFVRAFGFGATAWPFWALVVAGAVAWLRAGRRTLVAVCTTSAIAYIAAGLFTMNMTTAARYVLPALPFLALLAAGVVTLRARAARAAAFAVIAAWCIVAVGWAAPVYALRKRPAPAWAGLEYVRKHFDPAHTTVVFDGFVEPHAQYVLQRAGFTIVKSEPTTAYGGWLRPGGAVLYACPAPVPGGDVVFHDRWQSTRLAVLTRGRYDECAITRAPAPGQPVFSPEWRVREHDWELWGTGAICLGDAAPPRIALLQAGDQALRVQRAAAPPLVVKPGTPAEVALMPSGAGCLLVNGPGGVHSHLAPVQTFPLTPAADRDEAVTAAVLPLLARVDEPGGARWRSDVFIGNPGPTALQVVAQFLPGGRDNAAAPTFEFTLAPGATGVTADALAATGFGRWGATGALLVYLDEAATRCGSDCGFTLFSRTYNAARRRSGPRLGEGLPALGADRGLFGGGRATFERVSHDASTTGYLSIATWIPAAVKARVTLLDAAKKPVGTNDLELPPFGHAFAPFPAAVTGGTLWVQLVKPPAGALFYPAVTLVNNATGEPTHRLATPSKKVAPPEWLAPRPRRVPVSR